MNEDWLAGRIAGVFRRLGESIEWTGDGRSKIEWDPFTADLTDLLQRAIQREMVNAAAAAYGLRKAADTPAGTTEPIIVGGFNYADPFIIAAASSRAAARVTAVTDATRAIIRDLVVRAMRGEYDVRQTARLLRAVVGPTARDARAIEHMRDAQVARLLSAGVNPTLAQQRAAALADRASRVATARRARTIARTEIMQAQNLGRREGWRQAAKNGLIPVGTKRVWVTADPCDLCAAMEGTKVGWDSPFPGYGDPPAHPNCKCVTVLEFPQDLP